MVALQALLDSLVSRRGIPHAVLAVETTDRSFRWAGAAGVADPAGRPMHPATPFFIASIDKLFTAAAVLKLQERGSVTIDDSIAEYLPPSLIGGLHRLGGTDRTAAITLRHLLGHTSGIADYLEDRPRGGKSLLERLAEEGDRSWSLEDALRSVREDLSPHFAPQPAGAPRSRVRYSDTNYLLLIAILETVTSQPLHRLYDELFIRPLHLRQTWFFGESEPLDSVVEPAMLWFGDRPLVVPLALRVLRSMYSTADDLLRFLRGLAGGAFFEKPYTFEHMGQQRNRFGLPFDRAALRAPSWPIEYGLGVMRFRLPRVFTPLRPMPTVVGHTGSTGSWLFHCPDRGLLLAGTVDQATAGAVPFRFIPKVLRALEADR